jgi:pimeloyl-ACP methyl ester carboxylesterase
VVAGHSLGGYAGLLAACRDERIASVVAINVKSDWTEADAELAERSRVGAQRVEPERERLVDRIARSAAPSALSAAELELLAERGVEPADGGWRLRWDRRVLATEPVDPFPFVGDVRCPVHTSWPGPGTTSSSPRPPSWRLGSVRPRRAGPSSRP